MKRHHPSLWGERSRVCRRADAELDVTRFHQLKNLGLLAELSARILVDQHRPVTQFLELVGEKIASDAVSGRFWLVVGKAIMLYLLRNCRADPSGGENTKGNPANCIACCDHFPSLVGFFQWSRCNTYCHQPAMLERPQTQI